MKSFILTIIALMLTFTTIAVIPTEAESAIYEDTVRLHILAPSDDEKDQSLKLIVRDKLLEEYGALLSSSKSKNDAENKIKQLLPQIEDFAESVCLENGIPYTVRAELTNSYYERRQYENFTMPSGCYTSLKIIIGEGQGKNWWCVMYPPMCLEMAEETENYYSDEEIRLISPSGYKIKFKLLELGASLFEK